MAARAFVAVALLAQAVAAGAYNQTINGRGCDLQLATKHHHTMCNSSRHPEGHVCANQTDDRFRVSKAYVHHCSYDVGPTACATCKDGDNWGPKCLKAPDVTISQGLCSGRTWSISSCQLETVSVDWYGPELAKQVGERETAAKCASWTKNFCDFVGGTVKTDACAPGGPYCATMDSWWDNCHSDAYCAGPSNGVEEKYCCYSEAPRFESWSAKLCDGATVKGQALVPRNYVLA